MVSVVIEKRQPLRRVEVHCISSIQCGNPRHSGKSGVQHEACLILSTFRSHVLVDIRSSYMAEDGVAPLGFLVDAAVYVAPSATTLILPKPTTGSVEEAAIARTHGAQGDSAALPVLQDDGPVARERRRSCTEATQRFINGIGDFNLRDNHAQVMIEVRS